MAIGEMIGKLRANAKTAESYAYIEPSTLEEIRNLRKNSLPLMSFNSELLEKKIHGAWIGRICGCLLGKTVECIRTDELIPCTPLYSV